MICYINTYIGGVQYLSNSPYYCGYNKHPETSCKVKRTEPHRIENTGNGYIIYILYLFGDCGDKCRKKDYFKAVYHVECPKILRSQHIAKYSFGLERNAEIGLGINEGIYI